MYIFLIHVFKVFFFFLMNMNLSLIPSRFVSIYEYMIKNKELKFICG
jgi:F0F1-type ATP synthase membrane subunit a